MSQVSNKTEGSAQDMANILFRTPPIAPPSDRTCARLLKGDNRPSDSMLYITYTWSSNEKLAGWRSHGGEAIPAKTGTIVVGSQTQSATTSDSAISAQPASPVIKAVTDPTDLTGLSTELSKFFEAWSTTHGQFGLCFDSITSLLMYVSVDRACRFLNVLTSRVDALGATAHYHLNPDAHTAQTVDKLIPLFDDVVEHTENG